jgi:hypothetical protein
MVPLILPDKGAASLTASPTTTGGTETVVESFAHEEKRLQANTATALKEKIFVFIPCFN